MSNEKDVANGRARGGGGRERGVIMEFITFMKIVIVGSVIMYIIATKLGNKSDTASGSDSAEESLNANDSEKPLFPVPPEEHAISGITGSENMILMKINLWWGVIGFGLGLGMAYFCVVKDLDYVIDIDVLMFVFEVDAWIFALIFVAFGILALTAPFTLKIILDNDGIKKKFNICFGKFTIINKATLIPWSAVSNVSYTSKFAKYYIAGFHFNWVKLLGKTPRYGERIVISYVLDNYKEGLKYAVKKLPKSKFSEDAKDKLKIMGIWQ